MTATHERDIRNEFLNITLLLLSLGLWAFIFAGDILPGSLPDIIMFDAIIMIAVCGLCYFIKGRSFNFACFFLLFCIALIAVQISIASGDTTVLYLIPASLIVAVILLTPAWVALALIVNCLFLLAFAPPADFAMMLALSAMHLVSVGLLKRYFVNQLRISQGFQDYAADQMNEARKSRAKLVLMSKQLKEYQERLRVINRKLEIAFEHAEESRQAKARFAANVSHELRTPINLIVGFSEVMILAPEVYDQPLPASYRADIQAVYRNARHLQHLINDVLDISQLEARHLAIVREKASLCDCVREASDMVADLIAKKGLDFQIHLPPAPPDMWFDPLRIRQILLNLLINAIRFTSEGGIIIEVKIDEKEAIVSVADTGIGLSEADIKRVFEEFFQAGGGDAPGERGSGLGLTLSRELIRLHGGAMTVSSAGLPGRGSRFSFTLPTTQKLVAQMPTSNPVTNAVDSEKRVLVLDADEAVTSFFARYLKSHQVRECNSEADALRALRQFAPDALLLACDQEYPQLLDQIRRFHRGAPVVSMPMPSGRSAIRQRGVHDYLVKPVSRAQLNKALAPFGDELGSIMIIDDNRDIVRLFTQTLRSLDRDYDVRAAFAGAEGIKLMRAQPPDLLMLDVLMPEMDGFAVIAAMQADAALRDVPIILVSAKGASESITPDIRGEIILRRESGYSPIELATLVQALIDSIRPPADLKLPKARHKIVAPV
ncbi:MAG: ATP-binding protein [Chloroflexi bacterium]|nr:ATP-binding protein [Chloroflexota bacterium]